MTELVIGLIAVAAILALVLILMRQLRKRPAAEVTIHTSIEQLRAIGQLSVFKAITKEIVTETDHSWGEFGAKYLRWVLSQKKMAMIFEFAIDFRYDLRRPEFDILEQAAGRYVVRMPPAFHEVHIRDIHFYDEQRSRLLPWLLPDLLSGFLLDGFSEKDKNRLVAAAKAHAEQQAREMIARLESEVQESARATLRSIGKAFGAERLEFEFLRPERFDVNVEYAKKIAV